MDRRERQLHLRLDTADGHHPETGRLPGAMIQQR
jgi:hypothetical protein